MITAKRTLACEKLIVTTGGKSYPGCGTTGDGYAWLAALGHTIRRPRPALVPLTSDEPWVHELSGRDDSRRAAAGRRSVDRAKAATAGGGAAACRRAC